MVRRCSVDLVFIQFFFQDLHQAEEQLKKLKNNTQGLNDTITDHLKNITMEAENMAKDVGTKMKQIEGMMFDVCMRCFK